MAVEKDRRSRVRTRVGGKQRHAEGMPSGVFNAVLQAESSESVAPRETYSLGNP